MTVRCFRNDHPPDGWWMKNKDAIPTREDAIKHHTEALRLLDQLVKAIQQA